MSHSEQRELLMYIHVAEVYRGHAMRMEAVRAVRAHRRALGTELQHGTERLDAMVAIGALGPKCSGCKSCVRWGRPRC